MAGRVIVVGSINVDLVVTSEKLPRPGETVSGGRFAQHHGGKGANQAVAAARLGARTSFVGAVGADTFGEDALAALASEGIEASVVVVKESATGVALILVGQDGENLISVASGANLDLVPQHVASALERLAPTAEDAVLVGHEIATPAAREALRLARLAGATTIFNPAPPDGLDRSTLGLADLITPNRQELSAISRQEGRRVGRPPATTDPVRAAEALLKLSAEGAGPGAVLVSLGAAGAVLVTAGAPPLEIAAPHVTAVDTVGAGDTLNGALAAGLVGGFELADATRRAVVAASVSTMKAGARGGMPTTEALERALQEDRSG